MERYKRFKDLSWALYSEYNDPHRIWDVAPLELDDAYKIYLSESGPDTRRTTQYFNEMSLNRITDKFPGSQAAMMRDHAIGNLGAAPLDGPIPSTWHEFLKSLEVLYETTIHDPKLSQHSLKEARWKFDYGWIASNNKYTGASESPTAAYLDLRLDSVKRDPRLKPQSRFIIRAMSGRSFQRFHGLDKMKPEMTRLLKLLVLSLNPELSPFLIGIPLENEVPEVAQAFDSARRSLLNLLLELRSSPDPLMRRLSEFLTAMDKTSLGTAMDARSRNWKNALLEFSDEGVLALSEVALVVSVAQAMKKYGIVRPSFDATPDRTRVLIEGGSNYVLFQNAASDEEKPIPYDVNLDSALSSLESPGGNSKPESSRVEAVTGSNSGGKTIYMKTTGQLVTAALQGLPGPAKRIIVSTGLEAVRTHFTGYLETSRTGSGMGGWDTSQAPLARLTREASKRYLFLIDEGLEGSNILATGIMLEAIIKFAATDPDVKALLMVSSHRGEILDSLNGLPGLRLTQVAPHYHQTTGAALPNTYVRNALDMVVEKADPRLAPYIDSAFAHQVGPCTKQLTEELQ